MKKYDREKKQWVTVEEENIVGKYKKRDFCRGKQPHDFVDMLPAGWVPTDRYIGSPVPLYEMEDRIAEFTKSQREILEKTFGIRMDHRYGENRFNRYYPTVCSVCGKKGYRKDRPTVMKKKQ